MTYTCPFCSYEFEHTHRYCKTSCPLSTQCGMMMCPNCRYEFVRPESKTINFFRKLFGTGSEESKHVDPDSDVSVTH